MPPERLERWLAGFTDRHGAAVLACAEPGAPGAPGAPPSLTWRAGDGSLAHVHVPFPPVAAGHGEPVADLLGHVRTDRVVGVLLLRRGGFAVGLFDGVRLVRSKVGTRYVQGGTAAGGWSQQRFARRREGQAHALVGAAVDVAVRLLVTPGQPAHLVTGGDRRLVAAALADPRLSGLRELVSERFLEVPDPRRDVLDATPGAFRAVRIRVVEAHGASAP